MYFSFWVNIFPFILSRFSFGSYVTDFFIHSLNKFVLKNCWRIVDSLHRVPYMQIYPLNACKLG